NPLLRRTARIGANRCRRVAPTTRKSVPRRAGQLRGRLRTLPRANAKRPDRRRAKHRAPFQRTRKFTNLFPLSRSPMLGREAKLGTRLECVAVFHSAAK